MNVDSSPVPGAVHDIVEDVISSSQNPSVAENDVAYSAEGVADVNENANTTDASEGGDETKEGEPAKLADVADQESPIDNVVDDNQTLQIDTDTAAEIPQVKFASHMPH